MRALLTLTCGSVGGCFVTAAILVTTMFVCAGHAADLAVAAFTLAVWSLALGLAFLVIAYAGHIAGILEAIPAEGVPHVDR